ncbi:hypothetical protein [Phyllobacterium chamaecytisi]|uniref:hypothetical protein n=1 Tax=Phyllobacterium chamaecytisi TaxID=2876082 RepID=UPI001CCC1100|nr:hypothetical protein [Phyllobacterium sp. KW56]MBZ9604261.1 hypothetical protein [Phyllobacterium sp. KW56]
MTSFTLDMNCLIAIENDEPEKADVLALIEQANAGNIDLAMVASGASERQPGGGYLHTISDFEARMTALGFQSIELLKPIGKLDISFWGHAIYPSDEMLARETSIFEALFPQHSASWPQYAAANGADANDLSSVAGRRWKNMLCDAQAFWAHLYYVRDHFVTSDDNFRRKLVLIGMIPADSILTPRQAVGKI